MVEVILLEKQKRRNFMEGLSERLEKFKVMKTPGLFSDGVNLRLQYLFFLTVEP